MGALIRIYKKQVRGLSRQTKVIAVVLAQIKHEESIKN